MRFLSWGCGVQSTTLGEMSAQGCLEPLDAIITADTQWERAKTYEARDFYMERWRKMGLQVEIVTAGSVLQLGAIEHIHIPFWTSDGGPLQRQCTRHFKITPVKRKIREIMGYHATKPPHPKSGEAEVWLGISLDEGHRAKHSRVKFQRHRFPLLEKNMARWDCKNWLKERGLPVPVRSACKGCPNRRASGWIAMRDEAPDEFAEVVAFDEANRHNPLAEKGQSTANELYIYKHAEPLAEANLEADAARERRIYGAQLSMMLCESGYCWT